MTLELSEEDLLKTVAMINAFYVYRMTGKMPETFDKLPPIVDVERIARETNRQLIEQVPELEELAKQAGILPDSP
jgi:hypothetical protein